VLEVAKEYGRGLCSFYDPEEWDNILRRYVSLKILQSKGRE
jgi:hypothetical protein